MRGYEICLRKALGPALRYAELIAIETIYKASTIQSSTLVCKCLITAVIPLYSAAQTTSSAAEVDLLGSLSESFSSSPLAIVPVTATTTASGDDASANFNSAPSFSVAQSASTVTNQVGLLSYCKNLHKFIIIIASREFISRDLQFIAFLINDYFDI